MNLNIYTPTRVLFGCGALGRLSEQRLPGKKALIVISRGKSVRANGYLDRLTEQLRIAGCGYAVYDKIEANPLKSTVGDGADFCRAEACDFVIALGGGSCIDAAKAIAFMAANEGDLWDYVNAGSGKGLAASGEALPIIAVPTTAGTGSEVDASAVITNEATNEKIGYVREDMFPQLAVVDPELTLSVPPQFTAFQGFDALFHSVEGYLSSAANPISDMYALTAVSYISKNLEKVVKDGSDTAAREAVLFGSMLGGIVMVVGRLTSQHSLEHSMSAYHQELPHGAGLIMLSNAYFSHLIERHVCDDRFVTLARVMGMGDANDPRNFTTALSKLQMACGVADLKMSDYGISRDEFAKFTVNAKHAMAKFFAFDRLALSDEDCINIYEKSCK